MNVSSNDTPPVEAPRQGQNVFWSGHSLMDQPIPDFVAEISASLNRPMQWNRQYVVGSSIEVRTRGRAPGETGFPGYQQGYNRDTENLDVVAELRSPRTIGGALYDALVITEANHFLWAILRGDSMRLLRQYHDVFIVGNPNGQTFLYESWLGINNKSDPLEWIHYENTASPIWQCVATRINESLEHEGRKDRIVSIPAGIALAELVRRATSEEEVLGITGETVRETVDVLFNDNVHLTRLGAYYVSLISYSFLNNDSPVGAWHPADVDWNQASVLQRFAWEFVSEYRAKTIALELAECREIIRSSFAEAYWRYIYDGYRRLDDPWWRAILARTKHSLNRTRNTQVWRRGFGEEVPDNPLRFDPATDHAYWHPLP